MTRDGSSTHSEFAFVTFHFFVPNDAGSFPSGSNVKQNACTLLCDRYQEEATSEGRFFFKKRQRHTDTAHTHADARRRRRRRQTLKGSRHTRKGRKYSARYKIYQHIHSEFQHLLVRKTTSFCRGSSGDRAILGPASRLS